MEKMQEHYDKILKGSMFNTSKANQIIQMKIENVNRPLVKIIGPEASQSDVKKFSSAIKDRNSKFVKFINSLVKHNNVNNNENSKLINNVINSQKLSFVNKF